MRQQDPPCKKVGRISERVACRRKGLALRENNASPANAPACLQVRGFNLRKWLAANRKRVPGVLASLGKLAAAGKLQIATTECACPRIFALHVAGHGTESQPTNGWHGGKPVQLALIACMAMQTLILQHLTVTHG